MIFQKANTVLILSIKYRKKKTISNLCRLFVTSLNFNSFFFLFFSPLTFTIDWLKRCNKKLKHIYVIFFPNKLQLLNIWRRKKSDRRHFDKVYSKAIRNKQSATRFLFGEAIKEERKKWQISLYNNLQLQ